MNKLDSQNFKTRDAASYDSVTEQFDYFTERLTSPLAEKLLSLAQIKSNEKIIDIGTGGSDSNEEKSNDLCLTI